MNMGSLGQLEDWARGQLPDPLDAIRGKLEGFSIDERKFLLQSAQDRAGRRLTLVSPEIAEVLTSMAGFQEMFYLGIRQGDPTFSRDAAAALCRQLDLSFIRDVVNSADGSDEAEGEGEGEGEGEAPKA